MQRIVLLTACLALWLVLGQGLFFLVAVGFAYQVFWAGNLPAHPSRVATGYFAAVLIAFGVILYALPDRGFGLQ
jgi:hypothetical protein